MQVRSLSKIYKFYRMWSYVRAKIVSKARNKRGYQKIIFTSQSVTEPLTLTEITGQSDN